MIADPSRFFKDKNFPLYIVPNRTSSIDKIDDGNFEIHEAIEIKCFYEGRSTLLIGNEAVVANAGDIIIMNPYEFHATINYSEEKGKYHLIMIGLDFFLELVENEIDLRSFFFSSNRAFVNKISGSVELNRLFLTVVNEWNARESAYRLRIRGLLLEVLALLMRDHINKAEYSASEQRVKHHIAIEPALKKIRNEYKMPLTLDDLAEACCINKYHFCRIFKEALGTSPMQYLCDYRLNHADIILRNTEKSISDIISDCGFNDESYFYRCYRKHFGETPNSRRKTHKGQR